MLATSATALGVGAPSAASAHCPLCTAGAVALGIGAYKLGFSTLSVGIALGAFAAALGFWFARIVRKRYIPYQYGIIALVVYAATVLPAVPFLPGAYGLYLPWFSQYGTTIVIPRSLVGALIGGAIMLIVPYASNAISRIRGKARIPFQGIMVSIISILLAIGIIEILV
ncbi:hypothetical protein BK004_00810 [bacterium CG10_46_32]|nr:MAG: hypothetical protein BK004_00810 [bacterium CG10_46_32]PIR56435.1 MAG: hypothetical protein COU73_00820 [Parcubacteria group bacterium CG10_big_fil_rev_8_21_14_0_10_46_32]